MGGRGASSATSELRINVPTVSVKLSSIPMDESRVDEILDYAVAEGAIVYEKDRNEKNMKRDLFAHAALYRHGWEFTVLGETTEHRNIDLLRMDNGEYWEIKSPDNDGGGNKPLRFVEGAFSEAKDQFRNHPDAPTNSVRVVFNTHSTLVSDDEIKAEIQRQLSLKKNGVINSVIIVHKDGTIERIK